MAIQVRRGNEADFDASKMLPGEWAVSLDTKYVRMCFAPGIVLRMASYESFESDMELIQGILEECEEIQTAIERIKSEIDKKASLTIEYSNSAMLSADRANEEADRAYNEAERAKEYADIVEGSESVPKSRTIAGIDLENDITKEEMQDALEIDSIKSDIEAINAINAILQDAFIPRGTVNFEGDANLCVESGIYRTGAGISNTPHVNGFLIVFAWLPNVLIQICTPYTPEYVSIRSCWYGTWKDWVKIATEKDLAALETAMVNNI